MGISSGAASSFAGRTGGLRRGSSNRPRPAIPRSRAVEHPFNQFLYFPETVRTKTISHCKDHIGRRVKETTVKPEILPDDPLDPVPSYRRLDPVNADPQPVFRAAVGQVDDGQPGPPQPLPTLVNLTVFPGFSEQKGFREAQRFHMVAAPGAYTGRMRAGYRSRSGYSGGQPHTAPGATAVDHSAAGFAFHSDPKTVGAVTLKIAGLKGSLAHGASLT